MQKFWAKYGLAAHLALTAVAPLFLSPAPVIWLAGLAFIWLLMEPSRVGNETLHGARRRSLRTMLRDPLVWVLLVLVLYTSVRLWNTSAGSVCDTGEGRWIRPEPLCSILPWSVNLAEDVTYRLFTRPPFDVLFDGFHTFAGVFALFVVLTGCRHALGRSARAAFVLVASVFAGLGALVAGYYLMTGENEAVFRALVDIKAPVFIGSAFGVYFVFAVHALASVFERHWFKAVPLVIIALIGNAVGLVLFAPPLVVLIFSGAALLVFLYAFFFLHLKFGAATELKYLVVFGSCLAGVVFILHGAAPDKVLSDRLAPLETGRLLPDDYLAERAVVSGIAFRSWKESPWLGTGLGSFPVDHQFMATREDWNVLEKHLGESTPPAAADEHAFALPGYQIVPLNGYWLLLTERGVIGVFCLSVVVGLLFFTFVRRLIGGVSQGFPPPFVLVGVVLLIAIGVETLGDCSSLAPGVLVPVAAAFALSAQAFPKELSSHG